MKFNLNNYGEWRQLSSGKDEQYKFHLKDINTTVWNKKLPIKNGYKYIVFINKDKVAEYDNIEDTKKSLMRNMNRLAKFKELFQLKERFKEAGNALDLDNLAKHYKNVYGVGDCKRAAKKVEQRVVGFKAIELDINVLDKLHSYVETHWVAVRGNVVVDLTAPAYFKEFQRQGIASGWHMSNMNNVIYYMNLDMYEIKFKNIK